MWLSFRGRAQTSETMNEIYCDFYVSIEAKVARTTGIADRAQAREVASVAIAARDGGGLYETLRSRRWPSTRQRSRLARLLTPLFPDAGRERGGATPRA